MFPFEERKLNIHNVKINFKLDIMALELKKRKDGKITKTCCVGCKYDRYENWVMGDKDYCYECDVAGSERVPNDVDNKII